jgi:sugar phosphate isomerase/epimerase
MKIFQVGAQLYTVRDHLKGSSAFARTIERLKAIGYSAVELIHSDTVSDQEIANICGEAVVTVAAVHVPGKLIVENPVAVIEKLKTVGSKIAVYAFPAGIDFSSRTEVERLAHQLQDRASVLDQAGLTLAYHNHAMEFFRLEGELVYDVIRRIATGLSLELDAYWVQYAGMSPERWIKELDGKLISLHLKDFGVASKHGEPPFMTEVGHGNLDFPILVEEAEQAGCRWFIVEQDITPGDPFASLERSFRYVSDKLLAAVASGASL